MIEIHKIAKSYGAHQALSDVSLRIDQGIVFGILGPNGAGKTTLLRILTQIIVQDSGEIRMNGNTLQRKDIRRFAYLPEERGLYKKMKVREHLLYLARLKGLSFNEADRFVMKWLEKFQIQSWKNRRIEELSKGMQQKVQFIAAMAGDPDVIILDEPFSGFDPINAKLIKDEIVALKNAGKTIILSTHDMHSVEEMCDQMALIHNAKLLKTGSLTALKQTFNKNIYEVVVQKPFQTKILLDAGYAIVKEEETHDGTMKIHFRADNETEVKQILTSIVSTYHLLSFRCVYPSMEEIFISLVNAVA